MMDQGVIIRYSIKRKCLCSSLFTTNTALFMDKTILVQNLSRLKLVLIQITSSKTQNELSLLELKGLLH